MKKIIEAAEKICELRLKYNSDTLSRNLCDAVAERKQLEQTPITEEWLKEHGFEYMDRWFYQYIDKKYLSVYLPNEVEEGEINAHSNTKHCHYSACDLNLSDLYDTCELCGIELK